MASSSLYPQFGNRWLTSLGPSAKAGDQPILSIGSTSQTLFCSDGSPRTCQFTRYILTEPVGHNAYGEPLFDLNECSPACLLDIPSARS